MRFDVYRITNVSKHIGAYVGSVEADGYDTAREAACVLGLIRDFQTFRVEPASRSLTIDVPQDSFGNYDPSDALLDHLDNQR